MDDLATSPIRLARTLAAALISAALLMAGPATAWAGGTDAAAGSSGASPSGSGLNGQAELQQKAETLANQIQADGVTLDRLGGEYNAAQIHFQQLLTQTSLLRGQMAQTNQQVATARQALKEQAILAYLAGGAPIINFVPGKAGNDPSLTDSYAEIVAGGQKAAVRDLRAVLALQTSQAAQLAHDRQQASLTLTDIEADQAGADATISSQKQALAQVKGQLAVLVAQVQQANQQAEQSSVEQSLANQGQTLPGPVVTSTQNDSSTTSVVPATTTYTTPPTTAPVSTHPTSTQPATGEPTTAPPTTTPPSTTTTTVVVTVPNTPAPGYQTAIAYARAQIGVPYLWGGDSPSTGFDCSGLVMMAWAQAGVDFPHLAQDQYNMTARIPISDLLPGDLVFYGTPSDVYHVGLYIGGGDMIDAPTQGQDVMIQSIYYDGLLGGGRVLS